jgi:hypothetical protein
MEATHAKTPVSSQRSVGRGLKILAFENMFWFQCGCLLFQGDKPPFSTPNQDGSFVRVETSVSDQS